MTLHFNRKNHYLISIRQIDNIKIYLQQDEFYIYLLKDNDFLNYQIVLMNDEIIINYLDNFIIILPSNYNLQSKIWENFYNIFGDFYESLINVENNLSCINKMLSYIKGNHTLKDKIILDYGCGSGLSAKLNHDCLLLGYDRIDKMRIRAKENGLNVIDKMILNNLPENYFDAVFSCYVFHMGISMESIELVSKKMKNNAIWIANYYKNINVDHVSSIFKYLNFDVKKNRYYWKFLWRYI